MKHKFNIPNIGVSLLTRKGLPFPGALTGVRPAGTYKGDAQEDYEVEPEAPEAEEFIRGTRLRGKDRLGRWYFMPVSFTYSSPSGEKRHWNWSGRKSGRCQQRKILLKHRW